MSLNFVNNLEDLAEEIGKWKGMGDGIEQKSYMDTLINRAFDTADAKFNMAASLSADDFNFDHMYEYGTAGVGEGGDLDPMDQVARLWNTVLEGGGGRKTITFTFRPAVQPNPEKTAENTGITSDKFDPDKLQINNGVEYVWFQKAVTIERNLSVFIHLKGANLLFVPIQENPAGTNQTDRARGFTFRKTLATRPGLNTGGAGQFSLFFADWWASEGSMEMEEEMMREFNIDVAEFIRRNPPVKRGLKKAENVNVVGVTATKRAKTRKQWEIAAKTKNGRVKVA